MAVAFEAGRDGFWLARWLRAHGIQAHVIHPTSVAVSREHRRAKTDRLDTGLLRRAFLGRPRGEPDHCSMVAIPTLEEEDAKRPNRERESLIGERTRIINRMRGCLARLGIRSFRPTLRTAPGRLETLRTPEGATLPPNTLAELRRDMARLRFVTGQITEIEQARLERLRQAPAEGRFPSSGCAKAPALASATLVESVKSGGPTGLHQHRPALLWGHLCGLGHPSGTPFSNGHPAAAATVILTAWWRLDSPTRRDDPRPASQSFNQAVDSLKVRIYIQPHG